MLKTNTQKTSSLTEELLETVLVIGKTKTKNVLRNARKVEQNIKCNDDAIKAVLNKVSIATNVAAKDIVYSIKRDDNLKIARCLTVAFLINSLKVKAATVAKLLNKSQTMINNYLQIFSKCKFENPKVDFDKKIANYYKEILPTITI